MHDHIREEILGDIAAILDAETFTNGPEVEAFERAYAAYCGTAACIGVASGLDALRLALLAAGVAPGDEVIVPANTFIATFEAVSQAGARPVVVDITEADANMDVDAVAAAVTARTRYLLPVHLYGQMADMRALGEIAVRHGLTAVEDACQAHGATRDGLRAGACGLAAGFSFWPGKNLGAIGDAGALVTQDDRLAERARAYREHGQAVKHRYDVDGYTARLDTIQAAVLLRKLPFLDGWNAQRRAAAQFYNEQLLGIGDLRVPNVPAGSEPVWHLYLLRSGRRDELAAHLAVRGIVTSLDARQPGHLSAAFSWLGYERGAFPVTERTSTESILLPLYPGITEEQLFAVVDAVVEFFDGR